MARVALVGNPNTGKSTLFNLLTGMQQRTGNFPGVTVERNSGKLALSDGTQVMLIDLPGAYSLYPQSLDERISAQILLQKSDPDHPDAVIYIADVNNLKRNLVMLTQLKDLGIRTILAVNMMDEAQAKGLQLDLGALSVGLGLPVIGISARKNQGIESLKDSVRRLLLKPEAEHAEDYREMLLDSLNHHTNPLPHPAKDYGKAQREDLIGRHLEAARLAGKHFESPIRKASPMQQWLDRILTHHIWGYLIFFGILFIIFQAIFSWAELPMEWIEQAFSALSIWMRGTMPPGILTNLLTDGVLPGLSGVISFIPQIGFLFIFISILEDSGYMARAAFLFDRVMRRFGMNGKSVVPLISGTACAVPAILSTRNIEGAAPRLITILVTPLMSCSARLPVYILLIGLLVPADDGNAFISTQGLALMGLYLLGFFSAIIAGWVFSAILKPKKSPFILEMPLYRLPLVRNVLGNTYRKLLDFVGSAGKIILAISIILWFLASFGPANFGMGKATSASISPTEKLENSFAGHLGHAIEPAIRPLGFDWKIGIALITSFAAREVFVGTISTIYGIEGGGSDFSSLKTKMLADKNRLTGKKVYTAATIISLLLFYVFAMQCMSTIAVTYRETASLRWTLVQVGYMTGLAYLSALAAYQFLS